MGEFSQFNFKFNPYAAINRAPTEEAAFLADTLERIIIPSIQFMGPDSPIDWEVFYKTFARLTHSPVILQMIRFPGGGSLPQSQPEEPKMPSRSVRTYQRVNQPSVPSPGRLVE